MPAVYSTAAACQKQLSLRVRMIDAIGFIGANFSTHGDLSCFLGNSALAGAGFRGPTGHDSTRAESSVVTGVPVALVK